MDTLRRDVAIKVIKLGMDTRSVITRFAAERQALALMDHPNIARVFDAGITGNGRPFFVMELVGGARITEYCDRRQLSVPQRLELFSKCAARCSTPTIKASFTVTSSRPTYWLPRPMASRCLK